MFEILEHTADAGLRVRAPDVNGLFTEAARGLFALMVEDLPQDAAPVQLTLTLAARTLEDLLHDWLSELLYDFERRHLVPREFNVEIRGTCLHANIGSEMLDLSRYPPTHEVKAVTYHHLAVRPVAEGWEAEVIVDI